MESKVVTITPELALKYLEDNIETNRPIRQATVSKYARDMRSGNWRLTHQGIAFDSSNKLIDGQHRLWAIVEANMPIDMLVTTGIPESDVVVVDGGLSRSLSDQIKFVSDDVVHRSQNVQSFIRQFCLLKLKYPKKYKFSVNEMLKFFDTYPNITRFVYDLAKRNMHMRNTAYFVSIIASICNGYSITDLNNFVNSVGSGKIIEGYNVNAAIKFRFWYDGQGRVKGSGLTYAFDFIEKCEKAIYMYCKNVTKVRGYKAFDVDFQKLQFGEDVLSEYYGSIDD